MAKKKIIIEMEEKMKDDQNNFRLVLQLPSPIKKTETSTLQSTTEEINDPQNNENQLLFAIGKSSIRVE